MQPFQGGVGRRAESGRGAEEPERGPFHVDGERDHRSRGRGGGAGSVEEPGDLRGERLVASVVGALGKIQDVRGFLDKVPA
ncbi:hypothetical protein OHT52_01415 [Streptomyces sp. NBC_00247]|uniref:hypothetical protein n=1 Tax=Streptomyces sp. NBC_00247 TaxID=2975689 RepID=UPI002E2D1EB9|nr:hypothetical protein [Streptomyces sp. NBC_00247]